jgi:hypothetical protein
LPKLAEPNFPLSKSDAWATFGFRFPAFLGRIEKINQFAS